MTRADAIDPPPKKQPWRWSGQTLSRFRPGLGAGFDELCQESQTNIGGVVPVCFLGRPSMTAARASARFGEDDLLHRATEPPYCVNPFTGAPNPAGLAGLDH